MKVVEINTVNYGSTGKIMFQVAELLRKNGNEVVTYSTNVYSRGSYRKVDKSIPEHRYYGSFFENFVHCLLAHFTGKNGSYSRFATYRLVRRLKKYKPDVVHLHNLHAFCINLPILFKYLKKSGVRVIWTLHDCWSFTGHCPHFDMIGCDKWKEGCCECPQYNNGYLKTFVDGSKKSWKLKKKYFTGLNDMTIVTPSKWLAGLVKQSYLKDYPVQVIYNGIDLSVFKPTPSDFRKRYGLENKYIVLGVAFGWGEKKGLDMIIELGKRLNADEYAIVLVGTNAEVDEGLPKDIISIHRTQDQIELAQIYTAADVFVNPTREDTYPTVNMESIACGTPVVTFDTGGSPECIDDKTGVVVPKNNIDALEKEIIRICETKPFSEDDCLNRAKEFDMNDRFQEYVDLY